MLTLLQSLAHQCCWIVAPFFVIQFAPTKVPFRSTQRDLFYLNPNHSSSIQRSHELHPTIYPLWYFQCYMRFQLCIKTYISKNFLTNIQTDFTSVYLSRNTNFKRADRQTDKLPNMLKTKNHVQSINFIDLINFIIKNAFSKIKKFT